MNKLEISEIVVKEVLKCYDSEQNKLSKIALKADTEGEIRKAAGDLVEAILQFIFDSLNTLIPSSNIVSKVGSTDFLSKSICYKNRNVIFDTIQVDRHVWANGKRICFIENKTYLDSCYYDRALSDFRKIAQALEQQGQDPAQCKYIIFAGQNAAKDDTLFTYEADFWSDTKHLTKDKSGLETKIFFFLQGKRSSKKPLYKVKHELNEEMIKAFVLYILELL